MGLDALVYATVATKSGKELDVMNALVTSSGLSVYYAQASLLYRTALAVFRTGITPTATYTA